jgi:hypothetical protein
MPKHMKAIEGFLIPRLSTTYDLVAQSWRKPRALSNLEMAFIMLLPSFFQLGQEFRFSLTFLFPSTNFDNAQSR